MEDTGIGLTAAEAAGLFVPFERARGGEAVAGGTGLGLTISRTYARMMGGDLTVSSAWGRGSTFRFTFLAPPAQAAPPEKKKKRHGELTLEPGQGPVTVLVVDDKDSNRELLRELLTPRGFTVVEAANGTEALGKGRKRTGPGSSSWTSGCLRWTATRPRSG